MEAPCAAQVEIALNSQQNVQIMQVTPTEPDGSFQTNVDFKEFPTEHLDWQLRVQSADGLTARREGRFILSDDTNPEVEQTLALR